MALETTSVSVTEIVPAEMINDVIGMYAFDAMVVAPLARNVDIPWGNGKTIPFPFMDKDTAVDILTEGTTIIPNNEFTLSEVVVTMAQVGLKRETTKFGSRINKLGPGGLLALQVRDASNLLAEMVDDDLCAHFLSITDIVGAGVGTNLTTAHVLQAIAEVRKNLARGTLAIVLDDQQALDFYLAVGASTATPFTGTANQSVLNARSDGFLGNYVGADVFYSTLCDTTNTGANVSGACIVRGDSAPEYASLGVARLWDVEMDEVVNPGKVTTERAWTAAYGTGLLADRFSCEINSDAD